MKHLLLAATAFALAAPVVAGVLAVVLAVSSVVVTWVLVRSVRAVARRWKARRSPPPAP